ncbi:MAG: histidinol dehydrogenase [Thermodesulfobacteriota bacterium]
MTDFQFKWPEDEEQIKKRLLPRRKLLDRTLIADVSAIFQEVESVGDRAIREATKRFDGIEIASVNVPEEYLEQSVTNLSPGFKKAIEKAIANIAEVNEALMPGQEWRKEVRPGTLIGEKPTPMDSVGIYVPARMEVV